MAADPAEALALWRYHLIAPALDPKLGGRERGQLVRRIAGEHATPGGDVRAVSRNTLDRWIRRYRAEGLAGLRDRPRSDHGSARLDPALLDEAIRLRLEVPARSAAHDVRGSARTLTIGLWQDGPRRDSPRNQATRGRGPRGLRPGGAARREQPCA